MSKVHLLPDDVISKIAAGEVIERPASAVKELLENSLDAQTDSLEIHLTDAGKTLIHIKDSGTGIDKEDLGKIFLRHATSKIASTDDLDHIQSLGFRGEALYSIASIADITLRSCARDGKTPDSGQPVARLQDEQGQTGLPAGQTGWEIHLRGGKKLDFKPAAMTNGTEIEVRELFFNTPARRKFLKSDTTELNQILSTIIPYTLLHPACRFSVTHQGKNLLDLPPADARLSRTAKTLNLNAEHLLEAKYSDKENAVSIQVILGDINIKRAQRDMQFIFINNRPVQNKNISYHMNQIYQLIFPPRTFPCFAVFIQIPPDQVDVNIHPAKREVKIKNEYHLSAILRQTCEQLLMTAGGARQAVSARGGSASDGSSPTSALRKNIIEKALTGSPVSQKAFESILPPEIFETPALPSSEQYAFPQTAQRTPPTSKIQPTLFGAAKENLQSKLARARFIGSFINKFLLFEQDKSLFVVDQHAAQERIAFEHLMLQMEKGTVEVQHLLSPITIPLSLQEVVSWEEAKGQLEEMGFSSTLFDQETMAVHTYPVLLKNPEAAIRYLLSGENIAHCDHETIARRACRSSVMAGDYLNKEKAEYQRDQLIKCRDPFTCPHGRPTVIEMSEKFLDKQFLRT